MSKINIPHVLQYTDVDKKERTKNRLQEIIDMGMEDIAVECYGFRGIMSGLYIEMVWSHSDEAWKDYITWAKSLVKEKLEALCLITQRPMDKTQELFELCDYDFYRLIKLEENLKNLGLSNQPTTKEQVENFTQMSPAQKSIKFNYQFGKFHPTTANN